MLPNPKSSQKNAIRTSKSSRRHQSANIFENIFAFPNIMAHSIHKHHRSTGDAKASIDTHLSSRSRSKRERHAKLSRQFLRFQFFSPSVSFSRCYVSTLAAGILRNFQRARPQKWQQSLHQPKPPSADAFLCTHSSWCFSVVILLEFDGKFLFAPFGIFWECFKRTFLFFLIDYYFSCVWN